MKILSFLFVLLIPVALFSQEWTVPPERAIRLSSFKFSDSTRNAGSMIYGLNCLSCHGNPGKANFKALTPPPGDPATAKIQHNPDGALFFKISEGRGQMPSFKNVLSANDIWNVISYVRSFNPSYTQSVMSKITTGEYAGSVLSIILRTNVAKDSVFMKVMALKEKQSVPVKNAAVRIFVKRTFGQMPLGEEQITNTEGIALMPLLKVPGDTAGIIHVTARLTDEERFGSVSKDTILQTGIEVIPLSLTRFRSMWNVVTMAPIWLLITYFGSLLVVIGIIIYILIKLRDIYIIGKYLDTQKKQE
jgi:hypothetical protein